MSGKIATSLIGIFLFSNLVLADFNSFQTDVLEEHNKLRKTHQAPALILDKDLCKSAQAEAERKIKDYVTTGEFLPNPDDSDDRNYNDNTWASVSYARSNPNAKKILAEWIKQGQNYNWAENYFEASTGYFSQMIWKSTEELGVGNATGRDAKKHHITVVVVRYSPPGNILDRDTFAENVSPAKS